MGIQIVSFKPYQKNTLRGFFIARLTNIGLEIRDLSLHEKNGKKWIALPAKPYEKDGTKGWSYILKFYDETKGKQFQMAVLEALNHGSE